MTLKVALALKGGGSMQMAIMMMIVLIRLMIALITMIVMMLMIRIIVDNGDALAGDNTDTMIPILIIMILS